MTVNVPGVLTPVYTAEELQLLEEYRKKRRRRGRPGGGVGSGTVEEEEAEPEVIGGYAIGAVGAVGTIYEGYTLSWGDEFNGALDVISATAPRGRYCSSRAYTLANSPESAVRSAPVLGGYDVDPYHTGDNDSNKGVPVPDFSDSIIQTGSLLKLKSRKASAQEQAFFRDENKNAISSMIQSHTAIVARFPFIFECSWRAPLGAAEPAGWHPTFWITNLNPVRTIDEFEIDWEAHNAGTQVAPNYNIWTDSEFVTSVGTGVDFTSTQTLYGIKITASQIIWYKNGAVARTVNRNNTSTVDPHYFLISNHILESQYVDAEWVTAGAGGATMEADYVRVWRSTSHYTPLITQDDTNVDFNTAFSITLPTATAVWGSAVAETVEAFMHEANDPGADYSGGYSNFPTGVTYNSGTRALAGTIASKAGRLHIIRYVNVAGATCVPQRFCINVGPNPNVIELPVAVIATPYSYTIPRSGFEIGSLTPGDWDVSGLPDGLTGSVTDDTLTIAGTPTAEYSAPVIITRTNLLGQSATMTPDIGGFAATAVIFDGTNDYMLRGGGLTGIVDTASGNLSVWVRFIGGDGAEQTIIDSTNQTVLLRRASTGVINMFVKDSGGTHTFTFSSVGTYLAGGAWLHILASWQTNLGAGDKIGYLYINDVSDKAANVDGGISFTVDNTVANWGIGARPDASNKLNGYLAELWFSHGTQLDFSIEANRRKFIDENGKPVNLGDNGENPTGNSPILFLRGPAASFNTNGGAGGNFTVTGALTDAPNSPSD